MSGRPTRYDKPTRDLLTGRREDIVDLISQRMTNGEIAQYLDISLDGVKWHVREDSWPNSKLPPAMRP